MRSGAGFRGADRLLRLGEPVFSIWTRQRAIDAAVAWILERLNGEDGLGGTYPAMANCVLMFDALGWPEDHPVRLAMR